GEEAVPEERAITREELLADERNGIFAQAGLTLNDSQLFFTRFGADTELISAENLKALDDIATYVETSPSHLLSALLSTLKKPQFLMLIALFVVSALMVLLTSRRRGLTALLAAVVAFGAHIFLLMCNYDAFCYIAPFYLAAIAMMLFTLNGEDVHAAYARMLPDERMRGVVSAAVCLCLVAGCGGLAVYSMTHPTNGYGAIEEEEAYLSEYIAQSALSDDPKLFIGDNPADRYKYKVLEQTPQRGSLSTLLSGGYDLYSPRYAAMLEAFQTENPLRDSAVRDDILYVNMGFLQSKIDRITEAYGHEYFLTDPLVSSELGSSVIYRIESVEYGVYNQYIYEQMQAQYAALQARIEAGDPEAIYYQASTVLELLASSLSHVEASLTTALAGGDPDAIAQAQADYDAVKVEYDQVLAEYNQAEAALEAWLAEQAAAVQNGNE
ncbi:MAG: hypothetical protein Q4C13_07115, partial [Clostridia bacterium]|nr:hypothetical protein [Clostridia bacterium]